MDDIYIEPLKQTVESSERTDSDSGGGTSFVFHDGGGQQHRQNKQPQDHKEVDFGEPVQLELSQAARSPEQQADEAKTPVEDFVNHPDPDKSHHIGTHINITV